MADPSQGIHQDLLPHMHLLSTYRYAEMKRINIHDITTYLHQAPKIARDSAPFYWNYLDCPPDGTILLTWQPTLRRGIEFSSDGYVWAGPEVVYRHDVGNGLTLEIYFQRVGYRPGDQYAMHSRRRFRLTPPQVAVANVPQVDPNLYIVHYGPCEKTDVLPVNIIAVTTAMQATANFRQQLFHMGQIQRKEFMLSDRVNWPQIPLPGRGQSMYAAPPPARGIPQTMAYPPHGPGVPPKRRPQHAPVPGHPPPMMQAFEIVYDDEEDTSRGDMFDNLTAREVSIARYQQNHEWMEEILSSPYSLLQIEVPDLGLGLKGELASLTEGIFEAKGSVPAAIFESQGADALVKPPEKPYTGKLDPHLAQEFRKRMDAKTEALSAEVADIKVKHAEMVNKMRKDNAALKLAGQELRHAVEETGPEIWRLEGRHETDEDGLVSSFKPEHNKKVEEIVAQVEAAVGKKIHTMREVNRVAAGGWQEPAPESEPVVRQPEPARAESLGVNQASSMSRVPSQAGSQISGVMIGDSDIDMGGTAAGLLDQMHTGFSSNSTPMNNFPTPQPQPSAMQSAAPTPNVHAASPHPIQAAYGRTAGTGMEDSHMRDRAAAEASGTGTDDWVVVPKATEEAGGGSGAADQQSQAAPAPDQQPQQQQSKPSTPGDGLGFDGDTGDFGSLGDLDTAGELLGMDMEDSAFGDAFHSVGADTPGGDM